MSASTYSDYAKARPGWMFGLTLGQLVTVAFSAVPIAWALSQRQWATAGLMLMFWAVVVVLVVVPIKGRSATGWLLALALFSSGGALGATGFRSKAARGLAGDLGEPDLPGVLGDVSIHEGLPLGPAQRRIALIQNHRTRTWAITASVVHPGIAMAEGPERDRLGQSLGDLVELCSRTELVDEVMLMVRTVPDDGGERAQWVNTHCAPDAPTGATRIVGDLHGILSNASVRTESFVTFVVPEGRMARHAKESGGGIEGRSRVLYGLLAEMESHLRGAIGMVEVQWLTSPQLAAVVRTGFAPADRVGLVEAAAAARTNTAVETRVPWGIAGPSGAEVAVRHWVHDAWVSTSDTIKLPPRGALMGALAPVLSPNEPGERRSFVVVLPIMARGTAERKSASREWTADLAEELRAKARVKQGTKTRDEIEKARATERKLARGAAMSEPYAVATVTAPMDHSVSIAEFGRRLDASIRGAGFAPLRLDLAHDAAFVASTIPMGVGLTRAVAV